MKEPKFVKSKSVKPAYVSYIIPLTEEQNKLNKVEQRVSEKLVKLFSNNGYVYEPDLIDIEQKVDPVSFKKKDKFM